MVKQQCGYLNVCVYYSTSMENNYFYFWAKKVTPDLFSTHYTFAFLCVLPAESVFYMCVRVCVPLSNQWVCEVCARTTGVLRPVPVHTYIRSGNILRKFMGHSPRSCFVEFSSRYDLFVHLQFASFLPGTVYTPLSPECSGTHFFLPCFSLFNVKTYTKGHASYQRS